MCLERVVVSPCIVFTPNEDDDINANPDNFTWNTARFVMTDARPSLDTIFPLNVLRQVTLETLDDMNVKMYDLNDTRSRLRLQIILLDSTTRQNIEKCCDVFWSAFLSPKQAVSKYYEGACVQNTFGNFAIEPSMGVVGECVILCIELYFNMSNLIVYRDIMTTVDTTLRVALCNFNQVMGFPDNTCYTFLNHNDEEGWYHVDLSQAILGMSMRNVLRQLSVRQSYEVDYFRLSPKNIAQQDSDGILLPV